MSDPSDNDIRRVDGAIHETVGNMVNVGRIEPGDIITMYDITQMARYCQTAERLGGYAKTAPQKEAVKYMTDFCVDFSVKFSSVEPLTGKDITPLATALDRNVLKVFHEPRIAEQKRNAEELNRQNAEAETFFKQLAKQKTS